MKVVWKFTIPLKQRFQFSMPKGAKFLKLDLQQEYPMLWVEVSPSDAPEETRYFLTVGTGHPEIPDEGAEYVGTYQTNSGMFVFHVYELTDKSP